MCALQWVRAYANIHTAFVFILLVSFFFKSWSSVVNIFHKFCTPLCQPYYVDTASNNDQKKRKKKCSHSTEKRRYFIFIVVALVVGCLFSLLIYFYLCDTKKSQRIRFAFQMPQHLSGVLGLRWWCNWMLVSKPLHGSSAKKTSAFAAAIKLLNHRFMLLFYICKNFKLFTDFKIERGCLPNRIAASALNYSSDNSETTRKCGRLKEEVFE